MALTVQMPKMFWIRKPINVISIVIMSDEFEASLQNLGYKKYNFELKALNK
jgi:hypothetical protein